MRNHEEHDLLMALEKAGLSDIAEKVIALLDKREAQIEKLRLEHEAMRTKQDNICDRLDKLIDSMNKHMDHEEEAWANFLSAFPDGDVDGHRRFHDAKIVAAQNEAAFWQDMKRDIAKKGLWGLLVVLVGLVITGISVKLGFAK